MKHILLTTIAAVVLVGCATTQSPEPPTTKVQVRGSDREGELDVPILAAAYNGNIEAVKQHLAAGTDVNVKGGFADGTPLHYATANGHKEIAELLIEKGADVNAKDKYERTPLHGVTTKEIAELLIAKGADANAAMKNGRTALDMTKRHPEIAELLRKHGAKTGEELKAEQK